MAEDKDSKNNSRQVKIGSRGASKVEEKEKKSSDSDDEGRKVWVLVILVVTVVLGLLFSLRAGLPELSLSLPEWSMDFNPFGSKVYEF